MRAAALAMMALAMVASSPARSADLNGARAFVAWLYSHYPEREGVPAFDPTGRSADAVFDPSMAALLREDARRTPKGDVGAIDWDPICDCQDDDGLTAKIDSLFPVGSGGASAIVNIRFANESPASAHRLEYHLVVVHGRWRIHDIKTRETPSLRMLLIRSNHSSPQ
jgi:hypothetical protein